MKPLQEKINDYIKHRTSLLNLGLEKYLTAHSKFIYTKPHNKAAYSKNGSTLYSRASGGTPILLIPSHINKSYILDLLPNNSFLQQLEEVGLHPYLLEWGQPTTNNHYDLDDYIHKTLIPIIEYLYNKHEQKVIILGYCMGGLCATAATTLAPEMIAGLITIATPWNFHASTFPYKMTNAMDSFISSAHKNPIISKEAIAMMMQWPHINSTIDKFIAFANQQESNPLFIAVENWLDDGLDMTSPLFASCIKLLLDNAPHNNNWYINGRKIDPTTIKQPVLCIMGKNDKISPPECTLPLAQSLPTSQQLILDTGHIGLIISTKINTAQHIANWLKTL